MDKMKLALAALKGVFALGKIIKQRRDRKRAIKEKRAAREADLLRRFTK
jgi:hypothetical protein